MWNGSKLYEKSSMTINHDNLLHCTRFSYAKANFSWIPAALQLAKLSQLR
jgi:hypothetical protein